MASFIVKSSHRKVPMPSQFEPEMFTLAAFDNFDHEEATLSGIKGSHDTVSVLFQGNHKERSANLTFLKQILYIEAKFFSNN